MSAARRGPVEGKHVIGVDADPRRRPGTPMHEPPGQPTGAPDRDPAHQQEGREGKLVRTALDQPTPVFGSTLPPRGLSGVLRRVAYGVPEHFARHWMLLLLADRVDVVEDRLGEALARPLEARGADDAAARVRANPAPVLAAGLVGLWVARKLL